MANNLRTEDLQVLLDEYTDKMEDLSEHAFFDQWQHHQFKLLLENIEKGTIVFVHDFAKNILLWYQKEPQSHFWGNHYSGNTSYNSCLLQMWLWTSHNWIHLPCYIRPITWLEGCRSFSQTFNWAPEPKGYWNQENSWVYWSGTNPVQELHHPQPLISISYSCMSTLPWLKTWKVICWSWIWNI